jgi:hypothetical protein
MTALTIDDVARALAASLAAIEGLSGDDDPVGTVYANEDEARLALARSYLFLLESQIKDWQERVEALR